MRFSFRLAGFAVALGGAAACIEMPPGNVPLSSGGEHVEILAEIPNEDVYEPFQEISVQAVGTSPQDAGQSARHELRNRGAELQARFVSVEESNASYAWDFSGRTIVTLRGHAFRFKPEAAPRRR